MRPVPCRSSRTVIPARVVGRRREVGIRSWNGGFCAGREAPQHRLRNVPQLPERGGCRGVAGSGRRPESDLPRPVRHLFDLSPRPAPGQLGADSCARCHDAAAWAPASAFRHDRDARWPLRGAHRDVACARCHPAQLGIRDGAVGGTALYRPVAHEACASCHEDPHGGRLGADCDQCHGETSWREVATAAFDHSLTRYPLTGRHRHVAWRMPQCRVGSASRALRRLR